MRTRALHKYVDENGKTRTNVVWFGSTGIKELGYENAKWDDAMYDDSYGKAVFLKGDNNKDSFSEAQKSVVDSLTQRLSVIKGELWYSANYGLPLFEKNRTKTEFDAFILDVITRHPDVDYVISFKSTVENKSYRCDVKIQSVYGPIDVNI